MLPSEGPDLADDLCPHIGSSRFRGCIVANRRHLTTTQRGYGSAHQAERERWRPVVDAGHAECAELVCLEERDGRGRWIPPGSEWHLAHGADQQGYRGPAHVRCNTAEGARRMHAQRAARPPSTLWWSP